MPNVTLANLLPGLIVLALGTLIPATASAQSCDEFSNRIGITSGSDARVTLDPVEGMDDDKRAIECAFETATNNGISRVQLQPGDFYLSQIEIVDFVGSFEGRSISATTLNTIPDSIDCQAVALDEEKTGAVIRFVEGQPRLRTMTINAGNSCLSEQPFLLGAVVHFTGQPRFSSCDSDVIQGAVDRVEINGPGIGASVRAGIAAYSQGFTNNAVCPNTLLGTFKVNRSEISGFNIGIETSMQGGAQVDINFNEFYEVMTGYKMERSRQITSVTLNDFTAPPDDQTFGFFEAISARPGIDPPDKTSLTVSGNDFHVDIAESNLVSASGVSAQFFGPGASISLVAKENDFFLSNTDAGLAEGIVINSVDNAVVIDNDFEGGGRPVRIIAGSDNAILANDFDSEGNVSHVSIFEGVERTIIGPGQDARVSDNGEGTILTDNNGNPL